MSRRRPSAAGATGFCVGLALFVLCFLPESGRLVFDTNLVLPVDPAGFLSRSLHLWDDRTGFGELSDQSYGYLFPMGPFFLLCHALAIPAWIAQRAWMGLLLVAGYSGIIRLARAFGIGGPTARILGGLGYALTPLVVTELGSISAEAIAQLIAPWALVPLVNAGRADGPSPRRAAALSGVAILLMGGVNAFVTIAVLPVPALWILTRPSGRFKRRLAGWWAAAVVAATLWWVVPLLVFAKYSPRFILYIESAANSTGPTTLFDSLRGTTNWVPYVSAAGGPWERAGAEISSGPLLIAATTAVVAAGLLGLARRDLPQRRFFLATLVLGLAFITFGHVGALTPPWASGARSLLDGALAPFRNIHRFDAVFRIALVLGAVHAVSVVPRTVVTGVGKAASSVTHWPTRSLAHGALALAVVFAAAPVFQGRLVGTGSYSALPSWWGQAAGYLAANAQGEQALLLPASGFGEYSWGRTIDEPLAALASSPWAVRNQAPYAPVGNVLMMDAVEQAVAAGRESPGLADYLARSGVGFLVVRNDLDWRAEQTLRPSVVHATLDSSPGLTKAAAFGPPSGGRPPTSDPAYDTGLEPAYPAVEIYRVDRPVGQAAAVPLAGALRVSGGPDSVLALMDAGLLDNGAATVSAADPAVPVAGTRPAATDGLRRQEINFGKPTDHSSATLTAADPWRLKRSANDYDLYPGTNDQTVAAYVGVKDIRASSSGSDITATFLAGPEHQPYAAFDGDAYTFWNSANTGSPVGQWIEVDLDHPVSADSITVSLVSSALIGNAVKSLQVTTDSGTITDTVGSGDGPQQLVLPAGPANRIRLTVAEAGGDGLFGVTDVKIPGVSVRRTLVVPPVAAPPGTSAPDAVYAFTRAGGRTGCVSVETHPVCSPWLASPGEENGGLDRTFTVAGSGERLRLTGTVRARETYLLDGMLQQPGRLGVVASSQLVPDSGVRAAQVLDADPDTAWIAGPFDPNPSLTLSWPGKRRLTELDLTAASPVSASTPRTVRLDSPAGARDLVVPTNGVMTFPALDTDRVTVTFPDVRRIATDIPGALGKVTLPVGVADLRFPVLDSLVGHLDPAATLRTVCGDGPAVSVDGGPAIATRVVATVGDTVAGNPLTFEPCDIGGSPVPDLNLAAGSHDIRMTDSGAFAVDTLDLVPGDMAASQGAARPTSVVSWAAGEKTIQVGSGAAALLVVHENANPGWQAELDGHALKSVTVDGWQQAWIVPAGAGGAVHLRYAPDQVYRAGLLVGGLAAVALVIVAVVPGRRRRPDDEPDPADPENPEDASEDWPKGVVAVLAVGLVVLCGPWCVVPLVAAFCVHRTPRWAGAVAALTYAVAGVTVAVRVHLGAGNINVANSALIQGLCLVAIGCAASAVWAPRHRERRGHDI